MTDEPSRIVLVPAILGPNVPGAVQVTADCGHQAWISPTGLQAQLSMGLRTECAECVPDDAEVGGELPGARDELAAILGEESADRLIAYAKKTPASNIARQLSAKARRARKGHR